MNVILTFAGLGMCCAVITALLPDGPMRRTAVLALGLMLAALWAEDMPGLLGLPFKQGAPSTVLEGVEIIHENQETQP